MRNERGKSANTRQAILIIKKSPKQPKRSLQRPHNRACSSSIRIDPNTAIPTNLAIPTLSMGTVTAASSTQTRNLHHPIITLALIDSPTRADVIICIVSCVPQSTSKPLGGLLRRVKSTYRRGYRDLHCAESIRRFGRWWIFPMGLLGRFGL